MTEEHDEQYEESGASDYRTGYNEGYADGVYDGRKQGREAAMFLVRSAFADRYDDDAQELLRTLEENWNYEI